MNATPAKHPALIFFVIIGAATLATVLTFVAVAAFAARGSYLYDLFFERSWIQHASTYFFWVTVVILVLMHMAYRREVRAFEIGKSILSGPEFSTMLTWTDAPRIRALFAAPEHEDCQTSTTFRRIINALDRLLKTQSTREMDDYFRVRSEIDAAELETGYATVRYLIWLIPLLGLVGNVLGIGIGIASFAAVFKNAQNFQQVQQAIPIVTTRLGTAFDTTFLALVLSAVAVFGVTSLLKRQEQLLQKIDNLSIDGVGALFQEHSSASNEIIRALGENVEQIARIMNGNRGAIESVLRTEIPARIGTELKPVVEASVKSIGDRLEAGESSRHKELLDGIRKLHESLDKLAERLSTNTR